MNIEVCCAPRPGEVLTQSLDLSAPVSVAQALQALEVSCADWADAVREALARRCATSIWGRRVALDEVLRDADRLEITRALLVDPKIARRQRFRGQGSKTAGLFSKRRPGGKAGY